MKRILNTSIFYTVLGLVAGVFYREFTKFSHFTGDTQLSVLHTHILILGMFFFLIVLLLEKNFDLSTAAPKKFKLFYWHYNGGLILTAIMMVIHGTLSVLEIPFSSAMAAAIAGVAGIGHIILAVGFFFFFSALRSALGLTKKKA